MAQQTTSNDNHDVYDVVIIGAGFSGLSAGLYFKDCNVTNFAMLEARNRVGGRSCNEIVKLDDGTSCYCDAGGAYVGPGQNRILRLLNRFGIKTYHVYMKGKSTLEYNKRLSHYTGAVPSNTPIFTLFDLNYCMRETDKLAKLINTKDIHKSKMNRKLLIKYDNMTIKEWIESIITNKEAKSQYHDLVKTFLCVNPSEVSMLYWLYFINSTNSCGIDQLMETQNGGQDSKIIGGSHGLCINIQKEINSDLNRINLKHAVKLIEEKKDFIHIQCQNNLSFRSKYVLCAFAPALYNKIEWKPQLSWQRTAISNRMPMGFILKTTAYFSTAWWRKDGLNGFSVSCGDDNDDINDNHASPVVATFDDCKPDGSFPCIVGFLLANECKKYIELNYNERKDCVLKQYSRIFKNNKAITECIGYYEKSWHSEEWSGGCYVGTTAPNVMTQNYFKILKKSKNNKIYFSGTETADEWFGYMDGAIQSGEREANKIVKNLIENNKNSKTISLKKIYDVGEEPECDNCPLPYVNMHRSWIEEYILPNERQTKWCLVVLLFVLFVIAFKWV